MPFGVAEAGLVESGLNFLSNAATSQQNNQMELLKFGYDVQRQEKTWQREDNAVQRRVADLKAAGLSPTLAAGSAAQASAPIRVDAPKMTAPNIDAAERYLNLITQQNNIAQTNAQIKLAQTQQEVAQIAAEENRWNLDYYKRHQVPTDLSQGYKDWMPGADEIGGKDMSKMSPFVRGVMKLIPGIMSGASGVMRAVETIK